MFIFPITVILGIILVVRLKVSFILVIDIGVQSLHFIIAFLDIIIVVIGPCLVMQYQISHSYDPAPQHIFRFFIQLRAQLVEHWRWALPIEVPSVVVLKLSFLLSLKLSLILYLRLFISLPLCAYLNTIYIFLFIHISHIFIIFIILFSFLSFLTSIDFFFIFRILQISYFFLDLLFKFIVFRVVFFIILIVIHLEFCKNSSIFSCGAFIETLAAIMDNANLYTYSAYLSYFSKFINDVVVVVWSVVIENVRLDLAFFCVEPLFCEINDASTVQEYQTTNLKTSILDTHLGY